MVSHATSGSHPQTHRSTPAHSHTAFRHAKPLPAPLAHHRGDNKQFQDLLTCGNAHLPSGTCVTPARQPAQLLASIAKSFTTLIDGHLSDPELEGKCLVYYTGSASSPQQIAMLVAPVLAAPPFSLPPRPEFPSAPMPTCTMRWIIMRCIALEPTSCEASRPLTSYFQDRHPLLLVHGFERETLA